MFTSVPTSHPERPAGHEWLRGHPGVEHRDPELLAGTIVLTAASDFTLLHFHEARFVRRVMRKPFELNDFVHEVFSCAGVVPNLAILPFEHRAH